MTRKSSAIAIGLVLIIVSVPAAGQSAQSQSQSQKAAGGSDVLHRPVERPGGAANSSGSLGGWTRTILALTLVVALIFAVRFVARRLGGSSTGASCPGVVKVLAGANISSRERLFVVKFAGRILLIGSSQTGLRTLSEISDTAEAAEILGDMDAAVTRTIRKESSEGQAGKSSVDPREENA